jgi:hypothetical protein
MFSREATPEEDDALARQIKEEKTEFEEKERAQIMKVSLSGDDPNLTSSATST